MSAPEAHEITRLLRNWRAEKDSATLYAALARLDRDPHQRRVYEALSRAEARHAAFWEERLRVAGRPAPAFRPSVRTAVLIQLARHLGIGFVVPSVIAREMHDHDDYTSQEDARIAGLAREEHGHAAALRRRSNAGLGNNLRAAVLGANDGLASNFCLMMGVAGAGSPGPTVLLSGFAGLVAGACSMALGEWLSVTNARELAISQQDREVGTRATRPLDAQLGSPAEATSAASFSFGLFALGAFIPLLPFGVLPARLATAGSIALSIAALFILGVTTSLFNARPPLFAGLRQVAIGAAAAAVTYLAGRAFGVLTGAAL